MKIRTGLLVATIGALVVATAYADGITNQATAQAPATNGQSATINMAGSKEIPKGSEVTPSLWPHIKITGGKEGIPIELAEKLNSEQLFQLLKHRNEESDAGPLIVAIAVFGGIAFITAHMFFHNRSRAMLHKTLAMMIEKGVPIPPELLQPAERRRSDLRRGLVACGLGIGLMLFLGNGLFAGKHASGLWAVGFIPLFIGIARLIAWKLEQGKPNS